MTQSPYPILFEDADILVLNKPPGVAVNRADSNTGVTVQDWLAEQQSTWQAAAGDNWLDLVPSDFSAEFGTPEAIFAERLGLGHRLDKDTSGVLVIAKNPGALVSILQQFRDRQTKKTYTCLVHGGFTVPEGEINAPLARAQRDRLKFAVDIDGRTAVTTYKVQQHFLGLAGLVEPAKLGVAMQDESYQALMKVFLQLPVSAQKQLRLHKPTYDQGFSLVSCQPKTGRTHQIRVHLAHIHHPLVGDSTYTGKKRAQLDALWCPRQFLHASELSFTHPRTKETLTVRAPLPADLELVLTRLVN
jgi:23S rRNA pseudouridine1911/1915/1917 synthase